MKHDKAKVRKSGIEARESLSKPEREENSRLICENIRTLDCYKSAKTVMIYSAVRAEVSLAGLLHDGKKFVYPLCRENRQMLALDPAAGWKNGAFGIQEPVYAPELVVPEESIDLVICPCTGFDEALNRIGMGAGYYDRFLPKCKNAAIIAVAFEKQRLPEIPTDEFDFKMHAVVTESKIYFQRS